MKWKNYLVGVQIFLCNRENYGYLPIPVRSHNSLRDEADSFVHSLLEVMGECLCSVKRYISKYVILVFCFYSWWSQIDLRSLIREGPSSC